MRVHVYGSAVELQIHVPGNIVRRRFDSDGIFHIIEGFEVVENAGSDADGDEVAPSGEFGHYPVEIDAVVVARLHFSKRIILTGGV